MKKRFILKFLVGLTFFSFMACTTDEAIEETLVGEWLEVTPVNERTVLIFSYGNHLTRIDGDGNSEEYTFRIEGDSIFLSTQGQEGESELYFNKTESGRFNIGNLYVSIPEGELIIMTFEKQ